MGHLGWFDFKPAETVEEGSAVNGEPAEDMGDWVVFVKPLPVADVPRASGWYSGKE